MPWASFRSAQFDQGRVIFSRQIAYQDREAGAGYFGESEPFTVSDSDVSGVEVRVRKGGAVSGHVVLEGVTSPELAAGFKGVTVHLGATSPQSAARAMNPSARMAADGSFRITGVPPGNYEIGLGLRQTPKGFGFVRVERDGATVTGGIDVAAGEELSALRVVAGYGTGVIRGKVTFKGGPPPGARAFAFVRRKGDRIGRGGRPVDQNGTFVVDGLIPGEYYVVVTATTGPGGKRVQETQTVAVSNDSPAEATFTIDSAELSSEDEK